ncbi:TPA: DUF4338 domain-containing protein [Legionella pneumophila]|nr:DUF4338 domain-containing protein [Legionella pneumophila]
MDFKLFLTESNIAIIRQIVNEDFDKGITQISRSLCQKLNIKDNNGNIKDRSVRQLLYNLERKGTIRLPKKNHRIIKHVKELDVFESTKKIFVGNISNFLNDISITPSLSNHQKNIWDYYIRNYHYLKNNILVGRTLKQIVLINNIPVGLVGWSSPALHLKRRDIWLMKNGLNIDEIIDNGITNSRLLILPWVSVKNLCSYLLSKSFNEAKKYYKKKYNISIFWADSFVDPEKFVGTVYKASNWDFVGYTKGYEKHGYTKVKHGYIKKIFLRLEKI